MLKSKKQKLTELLRPIVNSILNEAKIPTFKIISDVKTMNKTYSIHGIDFNDMIENGEADLNEDVTLSFNGKVLKVFFADTGNIIDPITDLQTIAKVYQNRGKLNTYQ
jgi:hypothetical protein